MKKANPFSIFSRLATRESGAIAIGIAISLLMYIFVDDSQYFLGLGCLVGVQLARPASLKGGFAYGAIIAIPLGLYVNFMTDKWGSDIGLFTGMLYTILFACTGGVLGLFLVWFTRQVNKGTAPFF
jgi:hypothetical protein